MCLVKKVGGDDLILVCFEVSSSSKRQEILTVSPILQSYNSSHNQWGKKKKKKTWEASKRNTYKQTDIRFSYLFFFTFSPYMDYKKQLIYTATTGKS